MNRPIDAEHQRRLANVIRIGTIEQADYAAGRYKVRVGGNLTAWLPFGGQRAGALKVWSPLTIGEQVVMLSPSGDMAQGVVMGSIASGAHPSPGSDGNTINVEFPDGSKLSFGNGVLDFETSAAVTIKAGSITMEASAITVKGPITQSGGGITTTGGDHVADGKSLRTHTHGGVSSGGSMTGLPI